MAVARGGPTTVPMFPGSVVPRAKMRVTGLQTPSVTSVAVEAAGRGQSIMWMFCEEAWLTSLVYDYSG